MTRIKPSKIVCVGRNYAKHAAELGNDVPEAHISQIMTLLPGDLIATGTPDGIGPLAEGDEVEVEVEGVGSVTNRVVVGF